MRGSRKFCQGVGGGYDSEFFFSLVDEGKWDQNTTNIGPSSARKRNATEMAFRWRADDGLTLNAALVALGFLWDPDQYLLRNPLFLLFFRRATPFPPRLDPCMYHLCIKSLL